MAITFHIQLKNFKLKDPAKIKSWIKKIISSEKRICGDLSFVFMSDEELLKINKQFLDHDTYTDIITFDYTQEKKINGEIMVSVERVKENSEKLNTEFDEELRRVIIHGVLHLCGYKDKSKADKELMRERENAALRKF
jgi:rRNA maturation RNase YbeY